MTLPRFISLPLITLAPGINRLALDSNQPQLEIANHTATHTEMKVSIATLPRAPTAAMSTDEDAPARTASVRFM